MYKQRQKILSSIHNRELQVAIQPIVDARTMHCHSIECLARLPNVTATQLIETADDHSLGHIVSLQVLELSLSSINNVPIPINFNLSPHQLTSEKVTKKIQALLDQYEYPAGSLTIELTETPSSRSTRQMLKALTPLLDSGVRLSLDDFGIGSQSIQRVLDLPLQQLKIDRSFISNIHQSSIKKDIVVAIIELATKHQIEVVCEGVELAQESEFLLKNQAYLQQGYLHSTPLLLPYNLHEISELSSTFCFNEFWGGELLANKCISCNI
ncbi:hypothetical protein VIBNISOn1_1050015 [Vibrio nigripulchritudo SOn1]|uniref:EAL domain-containing protein n=1 Tax=Vibrio nigripulchritudo SOn1 TaxID=1238450 RepID=A0AAV2VHL7_9VIBR|nr:EAL domain-containing protein [Vibrio nigripulchritudo]CCO44189.1 hypothetical protein VIBNISOn1_1050015 [Vibrio nigripulchritudo SOn1]